MTLKTPGLDEKYARQRKEAIELCGKNRGAHDYIPIEWVKATDAETQLERKRVTRMMCRVCFSHFEVANIIHNYPNLKL